MKFSVRFLMVVLAVLAVSCGKKESQDSPAIISEDKLVKDINVILNSSDRLAFVGRPVELDRVYVQAVMGDVLFLAGPNPNQWLPMSDTAELRGLPNPTIKTGQVLKVKGTVGNLANPENPAKFWRLITENERGRIMPAQVYISGEEITILGGVTRAVLP